MCRRRSPKALGNSAAVFSAVRLKEIPHSMTGVGAADCASASRSSLAPSTCSLYAREASEKRCTKSSIPVGELLPAIPNSQQVNISLERSAHEQKRQDSQPGTGHGASARTRVGINACPCAAASVNLSPHQRCHRSRFGLLSALCPS